MRQYNIPLDRPTNLTRIQQIITMSFTMKVLTERLLRNPVLKFLKLSNDFNERLASSPSGYHREANQRWRSENVSPKIKPMRSWAPRAICRVLSGEEKRAGLWTRAVVIDAMIVYIDVWSRSSSTFSFYSLMICNGLCVHVSKLGRWGFAKFP